MKYVWWDGIILFHHCYKRKYMRKEIFNKELIAKYRDENGWISAVYKPEEFLMIVKRNEEK